MGNPLKSIKSREDALSVISWGIGLCWLAAALHILIALFSGASSSLLSVVLNGVAALFLRWKKSRVVAVLLLIWGIGGLISALSDGDSVQSFIVVMYLVLVFRLVQATFKLHGIYAPARVLDPDQNLYPPPQKPKLTAARICTIVGVAASIGLMQLFPPPPGGGFSFTHVLVAGCLGGVGGGLGHRIGSLIDRIRERRHRRAGS